jgi:1-phosphofructokinase
VSPVVVTVTPNPSLDRTVEIPRLVPGAVVRATAHRMDPGGKGVNVSRVLANFGQPTVAIMPGGAGDLAELLRGAGVVPVCTPADGATRVNTALIEPDGSTTKVNEPGVPLSGEQVDALLDAVRRHTAPDDGPAPDWVVSAGSLPAGAPDDLHGRVVTTAREAGVRVAVDTSGAGLRAAVAAGPDLLSPNVAELAELVGHRLPRLADVLAAARGLLAGGIGAVLVSMGAAGAVVVSEGSAWHAAAAPLPVRSTVGAGDSLLAGYLLALGGGDMARALVRGVACGSAAVGLPGTAVPGPADVDAVPVGPASAPDTALELGEAA